MPVCKLCGKEIKRGASHRSLSERTYCSDECYRKARGCETKKITFCQLCGKQFQEQRDCANLFCSKSCASKYKGIKLTEQRLERERHSEELKKEFKEALKRVEELRYRIEHEKFCKTCGKLFTAKIYTQVCCCPECSRRHENRNKDRRIYKNGQPDLSITLTKLYLRDGGVCKICERSIDFDCDPNSDYYPSIDHIIPIARGGLHSWDNVQLLCRRCNYLKGVKDGVDTPPGTRQSCE